ncbi:MAG: hypothetical protein GXZ19_13740, partial [Bacteroidales bacterium]|nr:hypothetical protein [Bacteroidales bacterium]
MRTIRPTGFGDFRRGITRFFGMPVVGRDERRRSSVDVWSWVGLKARKRGEAPESAASAVVFLSAD